jgi:hypothetical protein
MIRGVREASTFRHRRASHIVIDRAQPPHRQQDHDVHSPTSFCKTLKTAKIQETTRQRKLYLVWGNQYVQKQYCVKYILISVLIVSSFDNTILHDHTLWVEGYVRARRYLTFMYASEV